MAQTGYTPISLYYSSTASNTPTAGNLVAGELAINTADGKLFYKDSAGVVQVIGTKGGVGSSTTTQVLYNSSGLVVGSANMTFNGTTLTLANDASISGLTVGKGGGAISDSVAVGYLALNANTTGTTNTVVGSYAGQNNTTGAENAFFGRNAGNANTTGGLNTGIGRAALNANSTGGNNTAVGGFALGQNTTASNNTAVGYQALYNGVTGNNTAVGYQAGYTTNGTASFGTLIGYQAGYSLTNGGVNTFVGYRTGYLTTTGENQVAMGNQALSTNTTGTQNTAVGSVALQLNTTGSYNTALGMYALNGSTTASYNTGVGFQAGFNQSTGLYNTYLGRDSGYSATGSSSCFVGHTSGYYTTGSNNTLIGSQSGYLITSGAKNTVLGSYSGNQGGLDIRTASNYIVLSDGDGNPRGIFDNSGNLLVGTTSQISTNAGANFVGTTFSGGTAVFGTYNATTSTSKWTFGPNSGGTFLVYTTAGAGVNLPYGNTSWGSSSDIRLKNVTGGFTNALSDIAQLEPIRFTWKNDNSNKPCVGLSAQSVQKVLPEVIDEEATVDGDETKYLSVRYTEIIPLLVASIKELKAEVDSLKQQLGK